MTRLIHLNGPPGIGKSTLAKRYAEDHPGVLNCDIDVLRTLVGGWSNDFDTAGALIRPVALSMIETYLASGHDVILPQMIGDPQELSRFERSALQAGARFEERFVMDEVNRAVDRFDRRGSAEPGEPWHAQVRAIVAAQGGRDSLVQTYRALERLLEQRPTAVVIDSTEGAVDATYRLLLSTLQ